MGSVLQVILGPTRLLQRVLQLGRDEGRFGPPGHHGGALLLGRQRAEGPVPLIRWTWRTDGLVLLRADALLDMVPTLASRGLLDMLTRCPANFKSFWNTQCHYVGRWMLF